MMLYPRHFLIALVSLLTTLMLGCSHQEPATPVQTAAPHTAPSVAASPVARQRKMQMIQRTQAAERAHAQMMKQANK